MFYNFSTVELQSHAAEPVYQSAGLIKKIINLIPRASERGESPENEVGK